jgi:lactoylglutathione lyase
MRRALLALALAVGCHRPHIGGVAHVALYVKDLAKSRLFYEGILGFEEPYALKRPDGSDRIAFVKINDQQYIELFAEPPPPASGILNHLSFFTDDARRLRDELARRGVKVPATVPRGRIGNSNYTIRDPEGHQVELVQYEPDGWSVRERGRFMPATRIATHVGHLGIGVAALDRERQFYSDTLGLREIGREARQIRMRVPAGNDQLELILAGENHLSLVTADRRAALEAAQARAARKGYPLAVEVEAGRAVVHDPDGFRIEVIEDR